MVRQSSNCHGGGMVNLVVAHSLEARPLISLFKLKRQSVRPFQIYSDDKGTALIVSGMGKMAAAAAVAFLAASQEHDIHGTRAWLNIGIAGHQTEPVGSLLLAGKIIDGATGQSVYPALQLAQLPVVELVTVDSPELKYPENKAYEMEAYGFYTSAIRFVTAELIQVCKIISDNPASSVDNINAEIIAQWTFNHSDALRHLLANLKSLSTEYNLAYELPQEYERLRRSRPFSSTQEAQLRRLYRSYYALGLSDLEKHLNSTPGISSRQLLQQLQQLLAVAE